MIELLVKYLMTKMIDSKAVSRSDYLKCKLGLEVFFINVTKMTVVYSLALFFHVALEVMIFHSAFMAIRFFSYGAHSASSTGCTIISSVLFVGIPIALQNLTISFNWLIMIGLINMLLLYKYAPRKTKKNHIGNEQHQQQLKRKALLVSSCLMIVGVLTNHAMGSLIVLGSALCGVLVTPLADKVLSFSFELSIIQAKMEEQRHDGFSVKNIYRIWWLEH